MTALTGALGPSGTLIVPALATLLLLWLAIRVARAIVHLVVVALVAALVVWGYTHYTHAAALQSAARQLVGQMHLAPGAGTAVLSPTTAPTARTPLAQARAALLSAGLDPTAVHVTVSCVSGRAVLVVADTQAIGAVAALNGAEARVPLSSAVPCGGAP